MPLLDANFDRARLLSLPVYVVVPYLDELELVLEAW
jgi:hypothetical protein